MSDGLWVPSNEFEEEIVSLQPERDFIFGTQFAYDAESFRPRPKAHIENMIKQRKQKQDMEKLLLELPPKDAQRQKLCAIAKVQHISGTKPLGELPATKDWDNFDDLERETVAMMRHLGFGPSLEEPLLEQHTPATAPISDKLHIVRNGVGSLPVFFDESYFKLKPRCPIVQPPITKTNDSETGDTTDVSPSIDSFEQIDDTSSADSSSNVSSGWVRAVKKQEQDIPYKLLEDSTSSSNNLDNSHSTYDTNRSSDNIDVQSWIGSSVWYKPNKKEKKCLKKR